MSHESIYNLKCIITNSETSEEALNCDFFISKGDICQIGEFLFQYEIGKEDKPSEPPVTGWEW